MPPTHAAGAAAAAARAEAAGDGATQTAAAGRDARAARSQARGAARHGGHPASISPGEGYAQRQAEEDYFRQIVQKISRYRFYSRQQSAAAHGLVVTRLTLARNGGVLDVALLKSSGSTTLDTAVVDTIRQASPFPPLPPGSPAAPTQTFIVPVNYTRDQ